jgi:hypothetical protein
MNFIHARRGLLVVGTVFYMPERAADDQSTVVRVQPAVQVSSSASSQIELVDRRGYRDRDCDWDDRGRRRQYPMSTDTPIQDTVIMMTVQGTAIFQLSAPVLLPDGYRYYYEPAPWGTYWVSSIVSRAKNSVE